MHTSKMMSSADFTFTIDGGAASLEDILPGFNPHDRVGVIVRRPGGSLGASALVIAAITRFYDFYRPLLGNAPGKLRIYPEIFIFHVGNRHMDHYWMDVWPPHKEVTVEDDPEQILEAVNDRGITRLLVEESPPSSATFLYKTISDKDIHPSTATFLQETISSAEHRIINVLAYSPSGRAKQADVSIMSCPAAEECVLASLNSSDELSEEMRGQLRHKRLLLISEGRVTETYRRITLSEAFLTLTPTTYAGDSTRRYISMM